MQIVHIHCDSRSFTYYIRLPSDFSRFLPSRTRMHHRFNRFNFPVVRLTGSFDVCFNNFASTRVVQRDFALSCACCADFEHWFAHCAGTQRAHAKNTFKNYISIQKERTAHRRKKKCSVNWPVNSSLHIFHIANLSPVLAQHSLGHACSMAHQQSVRREKKKLCSCQFFMCQCRSWLR